MTIQENTKCSNTVAFELSRTSKMTISEESLRKLRDSVRDGSFPDDNNLLTADLTIDAIPSLLSAISEGRERLKDEIQDVSKGQAGDVDEWIAQAKKVQLDIAKCKAEARQIVEEHERVEEMRRSVRGAINKVQLLEAEVTFTRSLEHEMQNISEISQVLDEVGNHLLAKDPIISVEKLRSVETAIASVSMGQPRNLLFYLEEHLRRKSRAQLQDALETRWTSNRDDLHVSLHVREDDSEAKSETNVAFLKVDRILDALTQLDALPDATALLLKKLEAFILPLLSLKSSKQPSSTDLTQDSLTIVLASTESSATVITDVVKAFAKFLFVHLPQRIRDAITDILMPKIIDSLIQNQLNKAVPEELEELPSLENLQDHVSDLAALLSQHSWPGPTQLRNWIRNIPQTWLAQRQVKSLDVVRRSFAISRGITRQVERIERQNVSKQEATELTGQHAEDDWNTAWDDESSTVPPHTPSVGGEDDASGWDLEIEDEPIQSSKNDDMTDEENDAGEAWGWADDSPKQVKKETQMNNPQHANGKLAGHSTPQEMVLTESITITDIPDHILEVIGKDLLDIHTLKNDPKGYFKTASPETGLRSSPALVLAMFRATAPTHYSHTTNLTNMHLYNDALYIVQKLRESSVAAEDSAILSAMDAMSKFARQTYTRELDVQRTILSDLLDGAQGFESCTEQPYNRECKNAIDGVVNRICQIQDEWKDILGPSHLMQSVGSLVAVIMHKIVRDVEDMEDITEAQGRQLVEFCHSISSLDALFVVKSPLIPIQHDQASSSTEDMVSTIALYVPNYFRFQYLTQILESNLVEINYLWKEGELHLDFTAEEVVDLIKALFSESHKRREAIYEIKRLEAERQN